MTAPQGHTINISLSLPKLASYAHFLLHNRLDAYLERYELALKEQGIEMQHYLPLQKEGTANPETAFKTLLTEQLQLLAENHPDIQIQHKLEPLFAGVSDTVLQLQVKSEAVFKLSYIRKKVFREFIADYTTDVNKCLDIIAEIDQYTLLLEKTANEISLSNLEQLLGLKEDQLLEAQQLSGTGSYVWNVTTSEIHPTPQLLKILGLPHAIDLERYLEKVHPQDRSMVNEMISDAIKYLTVFEIRYRYNTDEGLRMIHTRGKVEMVGDNLLVKGTVMDVTDTENMVSRLKESRQLYHEAQELAKMGNWSWDIGKDKISWSDEIYRICGLNPGDDLSPATIRQFVNMHDWSEMRRQFLQLKKTGKPIFYIGNIRLPNGRTKILEIKGKGTRNAEGALYHVIGTVQDVTNEQTLIRRLQDTERRYRHMETIANIGNWVIDLDKNESQVTDEFMRIYGIDPDVDPADLHAIRSFVVDEDRVVLDGLIERCKTEGEAYLYQCRIVSTDGSQKMLMVRGEAVRDSNGRIYQIAGTAQDITKEQDLLVQLQRSEVLYKQAQAIAHIGNWVLDAGARKMEWSDEMYYVFGLDLKEENAFRKAAEMVLMPDRSILKAHFKRCIQNGIPYDCHYRVRLRNGQIRHFRSKGEKPPVLPGKSPQIMGTVQDVTEQLMVEKQLRDNQKFTQKITDIAPSVIGVYNIADGKYAFMNLAVEKLLGYNRSEIMELGVAFFMDIIHPDDLSELMEKNQAALNRANEQYSQDMPDEIVEFKYRLRHLDGTYRWFQTYGTVFERDENGQVSQVLNVSIDISGEKQAEQALSQKNMLLQQSNSSLEEFAYIASHDLQEPLRKISTFGNMLETLQEDNLSTSGKLYLRKIIDSSIRMQSMISDVLSVSIIAGNRSFEKENLQEILEEVLVTLEYKIEETGARVEVAKPLPVAKVVGTQFRQLFQNLIGNSLKFARADVSPLIKVSHDYITGDAANLLGMEPGKRYLRLVFADNGIGFSNNYAGKIFAIFQRLHGKSEYEGTGIGLALCKKIVEHHNGIIFASGEPGEGAVFTIILPA